jgi:ribosomal protein L22
MGLSSGAAPPSHKTPNRKERKKMLAASLRSAARRAAGALASCSYAVEEALQAGARLPRGAAAGAPAAAHWAAVPDRWPLSSPPRLWAGFSSSAVRRVSWLGRQAVRANCKDKPCIAHTQHAHHKNKTQAAADAPPTPPPTPTPAATPGINPLLRTPGPPPPAPGATPPPGGAPAGQDVAVLTRPLAPGPAREVARAVLRSVRCSPKKLARWARILPRLPVGDAAAQCAASPTKAARLCAGVLASAVANAAANHGLAGVPLRVKSAVVGRAPTPKRAWFHGKGRAGVRRVYRSHLAIEVEAARGSSGAGPLRFVRPVAERKVAAAARVK